ncbi:unnamed protein product [Bursaphelenchus okinawaensis]|uniref:Uncharacterized protein n=1 Tax=Bursaphelenchus okinawaensis TaxID=465554 RepID=A0A811LCM4_9BILA|nr:unnamed protein product [Bursaphelenchus okinawaensis]CAG9120875.1 unnamed protein product [Bursaphelenchus okinawaensis]
MFANKVVIVTGSSSGIGKEAALIFAREGAKVVVHGQNEQRLKETVDEIAKITSPSKVISVKGPIQDEKTWNTIASETIKKFGQIDILVNNAGSRDDGKDPKSLDCFQYCMDINVKSVIGLTQACIPYIKKTKGNIINVSSGLAKKISPHAPMYAISKAALEHYTRHAAFEYAADDVRVNNVSPGLTNTYFQQRHIKMPDGALEAFAKTLPLKRMGTAKESAEMIVFVASDKCSYVTGETLGVHGGILIKP